jgi:cell division protein FtsB
LDIVNPLAYNGKMESKKRLSAWLVVIVGVGMAVRTGVNVFRLWKLGERVEGTEKQVTEALEENKRLSERLSYVQSQEFIEKEAREKLGYGREGETIVVVPDENYQTTNSRKQTIREDANWRKWVRVYLGF